MWIRVTLWLVFFYYSHAFNFVNHKRLLPKLKYIGVRGSKSKIGFRRKGLPFGLAGSQYWDVPGEYSGPFAFLIFVSDVVRSNPIWLSF